MMSVSEIDIKNLFSKLNSKINHTFIVLMETTSCVSSSSIISLTKYSTRYLT